LPTIPSAPDASGSVRKPASPHSLDCVASLQTAQANSLYPVPLSAPFIPVAALPDRPWHHHRDTWSCAAKPTRALSRVQREQIGFKSWTHTGGLERSDRNRKITRSPDFWISVICVHQWV